MEKKPQITGIPLTNDNNGNNPWGQGPLGGGSNQGGGGGNTGGGGKRPSDEEIDKFIRQGQEKIKNIFPGKPNNKRSFVLLGLALFVIWLATGIYTVNTKEEGVVLRFGKYVRTSGPGLNYRLPSPIEQVIKLRVTDRYKEEIGYRTSQRSSRSGSGARDDSREILMLTGDENIVNINFEVQWQIADSRKFLFNIHDPQGTVRDAAESAMREVVGTTAINEILSEGRTVVQAQTKTVLQSILDSYDAGIKIEEINMKGVPPSVVDEAFKDVQAAKINKQETINKAIAYSNEVIPKARGESAQYLQQAEAYKQEVIARAEGEASRFTAIHNKYRLAKDVTKKRMYLETMESVLQGVDKIILDKTSGSGVLPYLPLKELQKR